MIAKTTLKILAMSETVYCCTRCVFAQNDFQPNPELQKNSD